MVRRARLVPTQGNDESLSRLSSLSCFSAVFSKTDYINERGRCAQVLKESFLEEYCRYTRSEMRFLSSKLLRLSFFQSSQISL
jgi:hypothetical protein